MKLIFCPHCHDVRKLHTDCIVSCKCGKSSGRYLDDGLHAVLGGDAIPLGIDNSSFVKAIKNRPQRGMGERFVAFVIPEECGTVEFGERGGHALASTARSSTDLNQNSCTHANATPAFLAANRSLSMSPTISALT